MSEGLNYLISFAIQPQYILRSSFPFFLLLFSYLVALHWVLFLAGDLTQWHLPVGMKDLDLEGTKVKGKATSE